MPLNIKDPATDRVVRELALLTGEGVTETVRKSVEARLRRVRSQKSGRNPTAEILEIGAHCAALPELDGRSADDILGYDENGLPR